MPEPDASGSNDASAVNDVAPAMAPATAATSSSEPMQPSSESEGQAAAPAGTGAGTGQTQIAEGSATTDAQARKCGAGVQGCGALIVQPQSERDVSAGTSARINSWPLCLHALGPHAGHTQTRAHASQCVTVERASTGVCVHHARVSWISKQPGVICPS